MASETAATCDLLAENDNVVFVEIVYLISFFLWCRSARAGQRLTTRPRSPPLYYNIILISYHTYARRCFIANNFTCTVQGRRHNRCSVICAVSAVARSLEQHII